MNFDKRTGEIEFGIKAVGPFTNKLEKLSLGKTVYIDGPYGVFTKEAQNDELKVIFAGGIGVTPFVSLIEKFGGKNTYMFYSNKHLKNALMRNKFLKELKANYKDVVTQEKVDKNSVLEGRVDVLKIKGVLPKKVLAEAKFFLCGSPGFMAGISSALMSLGVERDKIFSEEFSL